MLDYCNQQNRGTFQMTVKIFLVSCSERVKRGVEKSLGHEIQW